MINLEPILRRAGKSRITYGMIVELMYKPYWFDKIKGTVSKRKLNKRVKLHFKQIVNSGPNNSFTVYDNLNRSITISGPANSSIWVDNK